MTEVIDQPTELGKGEPLFNPEDYSIENILRPEITALLVIDPQNDFCHSDGFFAKGTKSQPPRPVEQTADAIRQTKPLIDAAHNSGVPVIFTQGFEDVAFRSEAGKRRAVKWHEVDSEGREIPEEINSKRGTFGAEFFEVAPDKEKGDVVIEKPDWSAFTGKDANGKSLQDILAEKGIKTLVITGVVAETCVETTLRDAHTKDYMIVVPTGCVGSDHPEQLEQRMKYWEDGFVGDTLDKEEIERIWENSPKKIK